MYFCRVKILRAVYSVYLLFFFCLWFFLLFPFLLIPIIDKKRFKWIGVINRLWARLLFAFVFIPVKVVYEEKLDKSKSYILCPNHFSYLDIPTIGLVNINAIFVGKSALEKIPLFGWMYKKLHITVNRDSLKSKYNTMIRGMEAIDEGKSLVIFPEGGITSKKLPHLARFKDGAFRLAIEKQVPIVPVTVYNNWKILSDDLLLNNYPIEVHFHKPIPTQGLSLKETNDLKVKVFNIIESSLNERFIK